MLPPFFGGILDVGQCNDAYSAIQIALGLAGAFDCSVNELPLSIILKDIVLRLYI